METAHRELEEETGYRAGQMQPLAEFYTSPGIMTERMHVFMASTLTMVGARLEDTEQITVRVVEAHEARRLLSTGALRDGKTMAVLGMYFAQAESRACRV
jgi:ADP-ribose pyrophosphatase